MTVENNGAAGIGEVRGGAGPTADGHGPGRRAHTEAFLQALRDLDRALDENIERARAMKARIAEVERAQRAGNGIRQLVSQERTPLIVGLLTESAQHLQVYGSRVRRAEARALHGEGMTMDQIARLFGVTRQRVSALLREDPGRD